MRKAEQGGCRRGPSRAHSARSSRRVLVAAPEPQRLGNKKARTTMNVKQNPTKDQLRSLVASRDDKTGHHMLWVSVDGDVFLDMIPEDLTPIGYAESLRGRIQFRLETLQAGNGYVGPAAAKDSAWIDRVYAALLTNYEHGVTGYIDVF